MVPNHPRYQLRYTRIFSFLLLSLWSKMWSNGGFRRFCGRNKVPKPQCFQRVAGFRISSECRGCYTLPKQARYQLRYTPASQQALIARRGYRLAFAFARCCSFSPRKPRFRGGSMFALIARRGCRLAFAFSRCCSFSLQNLRFCSALNIITNDQPFVNFHLIPKMTAGSLARSCA